MQQSPRSSVAILGVPVNNVSTDSALWAVEAAIHEGGFHQIATANVDFLINSIHDAELKEILGACYLVLPDGMPLLWAAQWMGAPLQERVAGADLVPRLVQLSARRGYRIYLLGSTAASSQGAAEWMTRNYSGVKIVGRHCPPIAALEDMDHEDMLLQIEAARPDILLVAMGSPKQEKWLAMHRHRLRVPVGIGVGGTFDLLAGMMPRAPRYMQTHGLEWLYRTCQEPSRLGQRYAKDAAGLLRYLSVQLLATAAQSRSARTIGILEEIVDITAVMRVLGSFSGGPAQTFERDAWAAAEEGRHIVLDLAEANYVGADGLGALIHVSNVAKDHRREVWLTGVRRTHARLLHASQMKSCFRIAPKISDALRRVAKEELTLSIEAKADKAMCRIGGRTIPLQREQASGVCRQILQMIERGSMTEFVPNSAEVAVQGNSA